MKKLFTFCVSLLAALSVFAYDFQSGDLFYNITSNVVPYMVEVTYQNDRNNNNYFGLDSINIPSSITYDGITYQVTSIGTEAFAGCESLSKVVIPNSITTIGDVAFFWCFSLKSISIPKSVTKIGDSAFMGCHSLSSIILPTNLTDIESSAFYNCTSLDSIVIPTGITRIESGAFSYCAGLTFVDIPINVNYIGEFAFRECSSLTSITIPSSVLSIGEETFAYCSSLDAIHVEATTPPVLGEDAFNSTPVCYIPCGTLATYEASDWAQYVSEFIEEGCPSIIYELNGGVTNEYGWMSKDDMWEAFKIDAGITTLGTLDELKATGNDAFSTIRTLFNDTKCQLILDNPKWDWLEQYIMDVQNHQVGIPVGAGSVVPFIGDVSNINWCYALAAFFIENQYTKWPYSADYSKTGKDEAYIPEWKHAYANPTNPTTEFVLNAPYKEGYTFVGWYTNADFSGEKVTKIDATIVGTLYAKWGDYIPTTIDIQRIAEVRALDDNTETKTAGWVNCVDGKNIYIQDAIGFYTVGGLLINTMENPTCQVGDRIVVKGTKITYGGAPMLDDAVIESVENAELVAPTQFETLATLTSDSVYFKYFATRITISGLKIVSYNASNHPTVADALGNQVLCYNMTLNPAAFPLGKKVTISAVAGWYKGFQFVGDAAGIELAADPKKDTYDYPVRDERYTLTNDWVYSNTEGNFAANKPGSKDYVRGMAVKDGIIYFINRETQSLIRVDGATGEMLDPIKITGDHLFEVYDEEMGEWKSGVIHGYNDIKFDQAGNCLIGVCTTGGTRCQTFFIYVVDLETGACTKLIEDVLWDNPSLDQVQFRFDAFGAAGDVTKNGVVMAADAQSWNVYRWLIKNGVVGDGEQINCALNAETDESLFIEAENFGTASQIFPQDELGELFYVDGANTLPMLFDGDGMLLDDFINVPMGRNVWNNYGDTISINSGHLNGLIEFQVGEEYFLLMAATYSTHNVPSTFALYKFADENRAFSGMEPLWYFPHNGMGSNTNGYRTAVPSVDIIDNNTAKLYLYVGENGYACYTLNVGDKTVEPIDPTWQITYTSSNDSIVTPYATDVFGANIVSNTYENGVGTITFDGPVTSIGRCAFNKCSSLSSIVIPNTVEKIGVCAFYGSSIISLDIPNSVTSLGDWAFADTPIESITIPNSVTHIGFALLAACNSLTSIVVEEGNSNYDSRDNCNAIIEKSTNRLIATCPNTIIPNTVTTIATRAFQNSAITSIDIPNSVVRIEAYAFRWATQLNSITIPNSVNYIDDSVFYSCPLDTIRMEAMTPPTIGVNPFSSLPVCVIPCGTLAAYEASDWASQVDSFEEEGCPVIQMCGDDLYWEYADGVLTITGTGGMYDYAVDTDVPWYDVRGNIKTVSLPDAMTKIGQNAFYKCTNMTTINMPTSLTTIGEKAFAQDTKLTGELTLPASLTTIDERAFFNCKAVTAFHIEATTPPTLQDKVFDYVVSPIHVPCGYGHIYGKHAQWGMLNLEMCELLQDNVYYYPIDGHTARAVTYHSNPTDTIVIPSAVVIDGVLRTVTEVADFAFTDCDNLPAIYFNEGLEHIGERAFVRCYGLKGTITLPTTLTTIGERAFSYCDNVEKYLLQAMTPPILGADVFTGNNKNALFYISCEAMDDYKVATNWSSLKSRLRDACLNIYHYNTELGANGVYTTEDTLVASIYYCRQFTPDRWETLYLPFEVDRVTVLEDGVEYDLTAWDIVNGGHYFLAKPDGTINKEILFGLTDNLEAHIPYIIQFPDTYYDDKIITFYSKESWNKLSTSFEVLSSSAWMQIAGNTTLQDQLLEKPVYMLRSGLDFILQKTTTTLHPFECYVMPYTVQSGAPARMSVRLRDDVATAVESMKGNESRLAYTINGNTLTVYPQGQAFSIYSLNGALIYSCEAGKEAVDCELNSGCYLLHAGTEAHKIML